MYTSMTGFGRSSLHLSWGTLTLEISSVNHRYQEIFIKLPREFMEWEPWFHQRLRKEFRRGKVQVRLEALLAPSLKMAHINKDILASYCFEILQIQRGMGQARELGIEGMVNLPGVLDIPRFEESEQSENIESTFDRLVTDCALSWHNMRSTEGEHLKSEILTYLVELERLTNEIGSRWLSAKEAAFAAARAKISDMLESLGGSLDEGRFLQEIVILADKWDITEELARLKSHIIKFRKTGDEAEPSGRKLDFIVQEMNREVNTLDSKIADADIRWLAVEAKTTLERIREQIQNLE